MSEEERKDIKTRFKKGQSGNPNGRPKGRRNNAGLLSDSFFKAVRIKDAQGFRNVPKIVAAAEVCLNNALKGDLRSFVKVMDIAACLNRLLQQNLSKADINCRDCNVRSLAGPEPDRQVF